jgi:hypothetical protein
MRRTVKDGKEYIYDCIRKKDVLLTPEEWVRQQIIQYLLDKKDYPASLFSVEKQIKVGTLKKRYDIVVYQQDQPWLLVECKSETEKLNTDTVQQILAYNSQLKVSYLVLTNGKEVKVYDTEKDSWSSQFPEYPFSR